MGLFDGRQVLNGIIDFPESTVASLQSQAKKGFSEFARFSAMYSTPPNDTGSNSWLV
jgi:hypothetical protein